MRYSNSATPFVVNPKMLCINLLSKNNGLSSFRWHHELKLMRHRACSAKRLQGLFLAAVLAIISPNASEAGSKSYSSGSRSYSSSSSRSSSPSRSSSSHTSSSSSRSSGGGGGSSSHTSTSSGNRS